VFGERAPPPRSCGGALRKSVAPTRARHCESSVRHRGPARSDARQRAMRIDADAAPARTLAATQAGASAYANATTLQTQSPSHNRRFVSGS